MRDPVSLRLGEVADAEAIRALTREAYAKWVPVIGREPRPMTADYDQAVRRHRFDLLYVGEVLAALVETIDQGDRLLVENVAVAPPFQGQGLGSRLLAHAEQIARGLGYELIWLYTNKQFAENVKLYLALGYGLDAEEDLGAGMVRVSMSKRLARD